MPENEIVDDLPLDPVEPDPVDDPDPADDPAPEDDPADPVPDDPADPAPADPPKQASRANERIRRIEAEKNELAQRLAAAEARDAERERVAAAERLRRQQEIDERDLDPDERWRRQANQQIQAMQFQSQDSADRSNYVLKAQSNPIYAEYADRVEKTLKEARASGFNPEREAVLFRLLGMDTLAKRAQAPAVKKAAAQRVAAARGQSPGIKTNVAATKSTGNLEERLRDIPL